MGISADGAAVCGDGKRAAAKMRASTERCGGTPGCWIACALNRRRDTAGGMPGARSERHRLKASNDSVPARSSAFCIMSASSVSLAGLPSRVLRCVATTMRRMASASACMVAKEGLPNHP